MKEYISIVIHPKDTLQVDEDILNEARANNSYFFTVGNKEAIAYYANKNNEGIVIVAAAFDEEGKRNLQHLQIYFMVEFNWWHFDCIYIRIYFF